MPTQIRVSGAIVRKLEDEGLPIETVLRTAGLPHDMPEDGRLQLTTPEFFSFYRAIAQVSNDPCIGLKLGSEQRIERYDAIAIVALCTARFGDALERMARYKQLTCPEKVEIVESGDEASVTFIWLLANEPEPRVLADLCLSWVLTVGRRGLAGDLHPQRVEFQRSEEDRSVYERYFQCPVQFNATRNSIIFKREDLARPFVTHNADLLATVAPQLEHELREQAGNRTLADQVKGVLKNSIAGGRPTVEDVARQLRVSKRTLQRRLLAENLTFQDLVKAARRELAHHYLRHSTLELNETAYLLGYEDANSFFRAFHEWEGVPPGEWRAREVAIVA